jgi:CRP/FNR family transcriptional regulator, cyclic AMP receptor protein
MMSDANSSQADPSKVWYLQRNRFFSGSVDGEIEANAHIFTVVAYPRRTAIFDQGDPTRLVYFVKRGTVRIARLTEDGKEVTVAVLGPGDMFGVESLFVSGERTTIAIANDDVLLCTAKADDLFGMLRSDPQLAINVAKVLSDRLGDAVSAMQDLAYARVSDRLLGLFRRLAAEHGTQVEGGTRLDVRLTHADIASLIGSTRETVSLEMANLMKASRCRMDGRSIVVLKSTSP